MAVRLDYQALRAMAECASSVRGETFWLVVHETGWSMEKEEPEPGPRSIVLECENLAVPNEAKVDFAWMGSGLESLVQAGDPDNRGRMVNLLDLYDSEARGGKATPADAVFWSESAVEKFLVPYYASVAGDRADAAVKKLLGVFDRPRPVEGDAAGADDVKPFAIAHIPKSEYVTVGGEQATASSGLHVLAHSARGDAVTAVPLEAFPAPPGA